jgi:hypothetical protein
LATIILEGIIIFFMVGGSIQRAGMDGDPGPEVYFPIPEPGRNFRHVGCAQDMLQAQPAHLAKSGRVGKGRERVYGGGGGGGREEEEKSLRSAEVGRMVGCDERPVSDEEYGAD